MCTDAMPHGGTVEASGVYGTNRCTGGVYRRVYTPGGYRGVYTGVYTALLALSQFSFGFFWLFSER